MNYWNILKIIILKKEIVVVLYSIGMLVKNNIELTTIVKVLTERLNNSSPERNILSVAHKIFNNI